MSDEVSAEVHGFAELQAGSRVLAERIGDEAVDRFEGVADRVAANVRARVPRRSGGWLGP